MAWLDPELEGEGHFSSSTCWRFAASLCCTIISIHLGICPLSQPFWWTHSSSLKTQQWNPELIFCCITFIAALRTWQVFNEEGEVMRVRKLKERVTNSNVFLIISGFCEWISCTAARRWAHLRSQKSNLYCVGVGAAFALFVEGVCSPLSSSLAGLWDYCLFDTLSGDITGR